MKTVGLGLILVATVLAFDPSVASAQQPTLLLNGNVGAHAGNSSPPDRTFNSTQPTTLPVTTVVANDPTATGTATVSAEAGYGRLLGRLSVATTATDPFGTGTAGGSLALSWTDRLTVTGPPGVQVQFRMRLTFAGSVAAAPVGACLNVATLTAGASIGSNNMQLFRGQPGCAQIGGENEQTRTFSGAAGATFPVSGSLFAFTSSLSQVGGSVPIRSAQATVDLTQGIFFSVEVLTPGGGYTTASGARYDGPPRVALTGVPATARAGDALTIGLEASNPPGGQDLDLYAGVVLPDGHTVGFLGAQGQLVGAGDLAAPASFVPMQVLLPGGSVANPALLVLTVPSASVLPPGTYTLFAALARRSAFADNVVGAGEIVAIGGRLLVIVP